jgi:Methyltransferase domain
MKASQMSGLASPSFDPIFYPTVRIKRWHTIAGLCLANGYRYGAELGVSTGRFTMYLCSIMPEMKMIAVDLWDEQPENVGRETYLSSDGWAHSDSLAQFKKICAEEFPGRVEIRRQHTLEAAKAVPDYSLDFVFIDADHSYEACLADIKAWTPKVKRGGMISGHDYSETKWPGVVRAVQETGPFHASPDHVWVRMNR